MVQVEDCLSVLLHRRNFNIDATLSSRLLAIEAVASLWTANCSGLDLTSGFVVYPSGDKLVIDSHMFL
jgi:hypothetical protein